MVFYIINLIKNIVESILVNFSFIYQYANHARYYGNDSNDNCSNRINFGGNAVTYLRENLYG